MILNPKKDANKILESLSLFESYINGDINNLNELNENTNNSYFNDIQVKLIEIAKSLENKNVQSLTVYGEIMLACEKLSDGFTNEKIVAKSIDPKLNYISKTLNDMFGKLEYTIDEVMTRLEEYSNQNFMKSIKEDTFRGGQFQLLLKGINNLKLGITKNLASSHKESMVLEQEAHILKDKANILSISTQKQSVSLEETSAAVVEISTNISSNTQAAKQMMELGQEVSSSSQKGEKLSQDTYTSMDEINNSTNKVYEAISIISQIAFQTNILSLNAAVEAATAGEAGKGFAVVAQEVRNLANKSSDAADEIGALMDELKSQANNGKIIANDMKNDYQHLSENINQTVELIESIVVSSEEQSIGISQVEDALNSIDLAVQENSSVSDEVSSVSNHLYSVAQKMLETSNKAQFEGKNDIRHDM